jgi:cob(I)alamin adenosyltransferase
MRRITRVTTGAGDKGQTRLADGHRVEKDSLRVEVYGTVDELNSHVGLALALEPIPELDTPLRTIQNDLFHLGSDLATPPGESPRPPRRARVEPSEYPRIAARHVAVLESWIEEWVALLGPLPEFILPGGSPPAAALHVARTVCRRAERLAVALSREDEVGADALRYLNRLSDALFLMARLDNKRRGLDETFWDMAA